MSIVCRARQRDILLAGAFEMSWLIDWLIHWLLHAGQLKRAGDAAKSGEFLGEFSWVEFDPMGVRGLTNSKSLKNSKIYFKNCEPTFVDIHNSNPLHLHIWKSWKFEWLNYSTKPGVVKLADRYETWFPHQLLTSSKHLFEHEIQ